MIRNGCHVVIPRAPYAHAAVTKSMQTASSVVVSSSNYCAKTRGRLVCLGAGEGAIHRLRSTVKVDPHRAEALLAFIFFLC